MTVRFPLICFTPAGVRRSPHASRRSVPYIAPILFALLLTGGPAPTALTNPPNKVAPDVRAALQRGMTGLIPVIVQTGHPASSDDVKQVQQCGGHLKTGWSALPGYAAELPASAIDTLAALPQVQHISMDHVVHATLDTTAKAIGVDIARASYGATGLNVGVAVLDSGVQTGPEIGNSLRGWVDFVGGRGTPYDDNGHGTHVAGILVGTGQDTIATGALVRFQGLAPGSSLVALKVLGRDGSGSVSTIISALNWCIANRYLYRIRVINLSLGHVPAESYRTDPLCQACESAVRSGLVVCAAAGNWGKEEPAEVEILYGGILSPGNDPRVITVGAAKTNGSLGRSDDTVCGYSSRGPTYLDGLAKPDLLAPGNRIISVRATGSFLDMNYPGNRLPRGAYAPGATGDSPYMVLSGTSMATPVVSAAAALMLERNPALSANTVKAILMYSAQRLSLGLSAGLSDLTQGAGYVNVPGALEIAGKINAYAPTGSYWLTAGLSGWTAIQGTTFLWSQMILWGNNAALGDTIPYRQYAWSDNLAWGENGTWSGNIAWGENAVTSDPTWQAAAAWANAQVWAAGSPEIATLIAGE